MLGHQLPALPAFETFWAEVPGLFAWLGGEADPQPLPAMVELVDIDEAWSPPATAWMWRLGVPFESIRFAASNRLCVALGYKRSVRTIEPYSLRRSREGNLIMHAVRADSGQHRSYRIDQITSIQVTTRPFQPRYQIELTSSGALSAPPVRHGSRRRSSVGYRRRR